MRGGGGEQRPAEPAPAEEEESPEEAPPPPPTRDSAEAGGAEKEAEGDLARLLPDFVIEETPPVESETAFRLTVAPGVAVDVAAGAITATDQAGRTHRRAIPATGVGRLVADGDGLREPDGSEDLLGDPVRITLGRVRNATRVRTRVAPPPAGQEEVGVGGEPGDDGWPSPGGDRPPLAAWGSAFDPATQQTARGAAADPDPETAARRDRVVAAMRFAWGSYREAAWGDDELLPLERRGENLLGGFGATIVDALDTLYLMGLEEEYKQARGWVLSELRFRRDVTVSVFETTIRVMGGLMSTFYLTGDRLFVRKARELADALAPAFRGGDLDLINVTTGAAWPEINPEYGSTVSACGRMCWAGGGLTEGEAPRLARGNGVAGLLRDAAAGVERRGPRDGRDEVPRLGRAGDPVPLRPRPPDGPPAQ